MEMQRSLGALTQAVNTLQVESSAQRKELSKLSKTVYVATAVIGLVVVFIGWIAATFKEEILQAIQVSGPIP